MQWYSPDELITNDTERETRTFQAQAIIRHNKWNRRIRQCHPAIVSWLGTWDRHVDKLEQAEKKQQRKTKKKMNTESKTIEQINEVVITMSPAEAYALYLVCQHIGGISPIRDVTSNLGITIAKVLHLETVNNWRDGWSKLSSFGSSYNPIKSGMMTLDKDEEGTFRALPHITNFLNKHAPDGIRYGDGR